MESRFKFVHVNSEDKEVISVAFETIERDYFVDRICAFMEVAGFGLPSYISDDINELIADRIAEEQEMKQDWDNAKKDPDTE